MTTSIRIAKFAEELNDILKLRYKIQFDHKSTANPSDYGSQSIIDSLDIYPSTKHIYARCGGHTVGSIRISSFLENNEIQNFSFAFNESAKNLNSSVAIIDMICLSAPASQKSMIFRSMMSMALKALADDSVAFAMTTTPSSLDPIMQSIGFKPLTRSYQCQKFKRNMTPYCVEISHFLKILEANFKDWELLRFREIFYFSVFEAGDVIAAQGDYGTTAYLILDGEVEVLLNSSTGLTNLSSLKKGHLIGEIALMTNETRTASLVATKATNCICFDRGDFLDLVYKQPHRSLDIFKIFSKRLNETNKRLSEVGKNAEQ